MVGFQLVSFCSDLYPKGPGICLYGIRDNLYKSLTNIEIMFYLVYDVIETTFSTMFTKEEVIVK